MSSAHLAEYLLIEAADAAFRWSYRAGLASRRDRRMRDRGAGVGTGIADRFGREGGEAWRRPVRYTRRGSAAREIGRASCRESGLMRVLSGASVRNTAC